MGSHRAAVNDGPGKNILDVILSDYTHIISNVHCLPPIGRSDHATINYSTLITALTHTVV